MHWNSFIFVDEVSAQTLENVVLQNPGIKKKVIYAEIFRSKVVASIRESLFWIEADAV